jgi:hypothetical protein
VSHYLEAFPDKKLLMRRPYPIAEDNGIGLYNDVFGIVRSTADFVDWFENGYLSVLAGDVRLPAMPDFWRRGPSGGEFANANQVREYVQNGRIDQVLQMVERSHVSWLGPSNPAGLTLNADEQRNLDKLLNKLGYRFRVGEASYPESVMAGETASISFTIVNDGVAPFYYDWPLEVSLVDEQGKAAARQLLSGVVTGWLPGENPVSLSLTVPDDLPVEGTYHLRIALLDPDTQQPGIAFAMEGRQSDGRYELGSLQLRKRPALERFLEWYASYSGS